MELQRYLDILKRRAVIIVVVAAVAVVVVTAAGLLITPTYTASATVRVILDVGVSGLSISQSYGERLMNTYSRILTSWPVLEQAAERLDTSFSVGQLRRKVSVEVIPDTELMRIVAQDQDRVFARDLANTLAALLIEHARGVSTSSDKSTLQIMEEQLASMESDLEADRQKLASLWTSGSSAEVEALRRQIDVKEDSYNQLLERYDLARLNASLRDNSIAIIAPALLPSTPSNALGLQEVGIGFIVGLSGGVGLALVLENLDTRVHSLQQLERLTRTPLAATVLGVVPQGLLDVTNLGDIDDTKGKKAMVEAYRLLSLNLAMHRGRSSSRTVLITSADPAEGKSRVAVNLARALAERGQTIFLVDVDLRHPSLNKIFDIEDSMGVSDLLMDRQLLTPELLSQAIQPVEQPSLFVISSSSVISNPTSLLATPAMTQLISSLKIQGQTTLLDAPPVRGVADVSILAPAVDDIILVVRQGVSKRENLLAAMMQLQAVGPRELGLVFVQKNSKGWGYR